ncbi:MAG TPA: plastocyanin/azurin family copper-binding protein [Candidatus Limnocylindrales bacterium]|jgi:hypothetical protein|nr:plastocyanin/azurin family copper-binding protein [Candidatus Limnocylindrales bacterium]
MKTDLRLVPLLTVVVLGIAACAASSTAGWTFAPVATTPAASPGGSPGESPGGSPGESPGGSGGANVIEVEETADLRILQDGEQVTELNVKAGQTYTFRVTNSAGFTHNFYVGTADALKGNQTAQLEGVPDSTGGTHEFQYTFDDASAKLQFACTVPGHYPSMHGDFVIEQ